MPNLASVLKGEIARLARKEIKSALDPLRKTNAAHRREIAELKRQVASMQRELKAAAKSPRAHKEIAAPVRTRRFVPKQLKALRVRLGLSAAAFGQLIGASGQSVYNWEAGSAVPRANQQAAIASVRGLGKREAARRLEARPNSRAR